MDELVRARGQMWASGGQGAGRYKVYSVIEAVWWCWRCVLRVLRGWVIRVLRGGGRRGAGRGERV